MQKQREYSDKFKRKDKRIKVLHYFAKTRGVQTKKFSTHRLIQHDNRDIEREGVSEKKKEKPLQKVLTNVILNFNPIHTLRCCSIRKRASRFYSPLIGVFIPASGLSRQQFEFHMFDYNTDFVVFFFSLFQTIFVSDCMCVSYEINWNFVRIEFEWFEFCVSFFFLST